MYNFCVRTLSPKVSWDFLSPMRFLRELQPIHSNATDNCINDLTLPRHRKIFPAKSTRSLTVLWSSMIIKATCSLLFARKYSRELSAMCTVGERDVARDVREIRIPKAINWSSYSWSIIVEKVCWTMCKEATAIKYFVKISGIFSDSFQTSPV